MKISVRWLRELCPVTLSDDEIARKLTFAGLEIEGRESRAIGPGVVAARIVKTEPIAGSDHLSICQVDDGAGTHQVVCGAQNYAAGDVVPMARVGAKLPNGLEIRRAKLRVWRARASSAISSSATPGNKSSPPRVTPERFPSACGSGETR